MAQVQFRNVTKQYGPLQVIHGIDMQVADGEFIAEHIYNSLLVIDDQGRVVSSYDKIHLVPFGEYLPFQDFLESFGVMQMTGVRGGFSVAGRLT